MKHRLPGLVRPRGSIRRARFGGSRPASSAKALCSQHSGISQEALSGTLEPCKLGESIGHALADCIEGQDERDSHRHTSSKASCMLVVQSAPQYMNKSSERQACAGPPAAPVGLRRRWLGWLSRGHGNLRRRLLRCLGRQERPRDLRIHLLQVHSTELTLIGMPYCEQVTAAEMRDKCLGQHQVQDGLAAATAANTGHVTHSQGTGNGRRLHTWLAGFGSEAAAAPASVNAAASSSGAGGCCMPSATSATAFASALPSAATSLAASAPEAAGAASAWVAASAAAAAGGLTSSSGC